MAVWQGRICPGFRALEVRQPSGSVGAGRLSEVCGPLLFPSVTCRLLKTSRAPPGFDAGLLHKPSAAPESRAARCCEAPSCGTSPLLQPGCAGGQRDGAGCAAPTAAPAAAAALRQGAEEERSTAQLLLPRSAAVSLAPSHFQQAFFFFFSEHVTSESFASLLVWPSLAEVGAAAAGAFCASCVLSARLHSRSPSSGTRCLPTRARSHGAAATRCPPGQHRAQTPPLLLQRSPSSWSREQGQQGAGTGSQPVIEPLPGS